MASPQLRIEEPARGAPDRGAADVPKSSGTEDEGVMLSPRSPRRLSASTSASNSLMEKLGETGSPRADGSSGRARSGTLTLAGSPRSDGRLLNRRGSHKFEEKDVDGSLRADASPSRPRSGTLTSAGEAAPGQPRPRSPRLSLISQFEPKPEEDIGRPRAGSEARAAEALNRLKNAQQRRDAQEAVEDAAVAAEYDRVFHQELARQRSNSRPRSASASGTETQTSQLPQTETQKEQKVDQEIAGKAEGRERRVSASRRDDNLRGIQRSISPRARDEKAQKQKEERALYEAEERKRDAEEREAQERLKQLLVQEEQLKARETEIIRLEKQLSQETSVAEEDIRTQETALKQRLEALAKLEREIV